MFQASGAFLNCYNIPYVKLVAINGMLASALQRMQRCEVLQYKDTCTLMQITHVHVHFQLMITASNLTQPWRWLP